MPAAETHRSTWTRFVAPADYEQDPGFRDVILRLNRKGMVVAGLLGVLGVLIFLGSKVFVAGKGLGWSYGTSPKQTIVLWDKLLLVLLSLACLGLAHTRLGPRWGRLLVGLMIVVIGAAMLVDDVGSGDLSFSVAYLTLLMLGAVGTMPYRPGQIFALCMAVTGLYFGFVMLLPELIALDWISASMDRLTYLGTVTIVCTIISALLYKSRYEQYEAQRRAEQLNEQVSEQAAKLREMEQLKARFFANISHEFRTPLTLILGPVQDALDGTYGPVAAALRTQLHVMRRSGLRLQRLINQLLDLSKLEAGRMQLHLESHNLTRFLRGIVQSFSSLAERRHLTLEFHTEREDLVLCFDPDKLEKVIYNLLSNAFKFTPEGGKVRISLREDAASATVELRIRDTGPGIPAEELPYLFDRFHQGNSLLSRGYEGTGIGLALSKELVELQGGSIRVESEVGFGSEFTVRLPQKHTDAGMEALKTEEAIETDPPGRAEALLEEDAPAVALPLEEEEPVLPADVPTILIVDDNADVRIYIKSHLAALYRIEEAADGLEGLEKARALRPDLVICDVMMPRMDGYELCRRLKTDDALSDIPVVLLTAKASEESKVEGLETGADDYIYKPFHAAELRVRVENLIELRRLLRQRYSAAITVEPSRISVPSAEAAFLERVRSTVEAHMGNTHFSVEWLADEVGLSPRQLQRRLRASTRLSAAGLIRMMRLQRAAQLLAQRSGTVSEIAYAVGFKDVNYFSRLFKQTFGTSPSEYPTDGT